MKLEEFKQQFESELSKRCEVQEKTIIDLIAQHKEDQEAIIQLQNRCYAQSHGVLCIYCGFIRTCQSPFLKGE